MLFLFAESFVTALINNVLVRQYVCQIKSERYRTERTMAAYGILILAFLTIVFRIEGYPIHASCRISWYVHITLLLQSGILNQS